MSDAENRNLPVVKEGGLPGRFTEGREVARRRDGREATGLEDVTPNALRRLDEVTRAKFSLQTIGKGSARLAGDSFRHVFRPVMPGKAPSNTVLSKVLRKLALRGKGDGIYNVKGELLFAGTSDNLLKQALQQGIDMAGLDAWGVQLSDIDLSKAKMAAADFRQSRLSGVDFGNSALDGALFTRAKITGVIDRRGRYRNSIERGNFAGSSLKDADFRNATLIAVSFRGANLEGADFTGARFGKMSCFDNLGDVVKGVLGTVTILPALLMADDGEYLEKYDRSSAGMDFSNAKMEGARFSINAPFGKLGLSAEQRKQITLVDRKGKLRPDLALADDGSIYVKAVVEKRKALAEADKADAAALGAPTQPGQGG